VDASKLIIFIIKSDGFSSHHQHPIYGLVWIILVNQKIFWFNF